MDKKVIFTIIQCGHGVYRIITNHMQFKKMNTACITDIDMLYETMISNRKDIVGFNVCSVLFVCFFF